MIEGKDTQRKRVETLQEFKRSGRDGPRVLLISSVGALGLNIAFANILVIVVRVGGIVESECDADAWRYFSY
jgi:hypothetical protein